MTVKHSENISQSNDEASQVQPLTMAQRLARRERAFLEGPSDLSERETRKKIVYDVVDARHQARQN